MKRIIPFIVCMLCLMLNFSYAQLNQITIDDVGFFPEDITIMNNVAYVSGLGDGTVRSFDLTQANPMAQTFAAAEEGYTQVWGVKSDGTVLLSLLNNANFGGGQSGPAKLVEYDIASGAKTGEWDLPAGVIGHTVSIVDGKYYVTNFGFPQIFEIDPAVGTVSEWFTSNQWDPTISGLGGTIYDNEGGFYVSQGNKLWYLPISGGTAGTLQEVNVSGLDIIDADGISWVDSSNTLFYATNDTGDPANVGTAYKLVFSGKTTALASVIATGLDDSSGLWYYENDGKEYVLVLESQFGALFGLNSFEPPFNIAISEVSTELTNEEKARALQQGIESGDPAVLVYVSDEQYIQHNLSIPSGKETISGFFPGVPTGVTVDIHRSYEIGDYVVMHTTFGGAWGAISGSGTDQVVFDVWRFEDGLAVEHWDNIGDLVDDMDGTTQTDGAVTPATDLENTDANQALLEEMAQTLFVDGDWRNLRDYFDLDAYIQHSVGSGADGAFLETLEGATELSFYDDVKFIHTLGNFGLVMSEGPDIYGVDLEGTYAYYDLFRMENGKIVEHWDVIQLIPPSDQWANTNGKWGDDAITAEGGISVYNSFEDATLTGGQQAFYGAAGPVAVSDDVEFPQFINFYDIDVDDFGLTMTLFNNSDAANLLLPDGRFDRYYFAYDGDVSNISISGGSPGLTAGAKVTPLPAGYEIPLADLFGTGYPLPITLPDGGFVLELGGGTDLTELGQTISVDFGFTGISVYNSFEDATLTGGQQAFYGAAGPVAVSDDVEFPQFINFYDIDVNDDGLTMTLFNNSDAADLLLPDGRFDRYYFAFDEDMSNVSISGGSPGLTAGASVTPLPAGYEIPLADLFGTGYPLPITLPDGGFVLELGGGTDLTELGQTISVDFGFSTAFPEALTVSDEGFFPEDITIANDVAYVSGLGDGTIRSFDLTQANPMAQTFAAAEEGYTQAWGVKSDGTVLLSLLNNANFGGGQSGPAKLVEYDIASGEKTGEWDLPAGVIGHTVSIVDGKYYVTNFGLPQIFEIDPAAGTVSEWFTSDQWDPTISGLGGTIYDNEGGFYISQGNKLWYLPISGGTAGTLQEVSVSGLDIIDADGISWVDSQNTLYYATNDTGDPANVGTVYKLVFSDATTATGSIVATGLDDSSGLWYYENDGKEYVFVLESQFGALFGLNSFKPPFNIEIIELTTASAGTDLSLEAGVANQLYDQYETVDYTFTLTNEGDAAATNIEVEAMLPEGMAYTSHTVTSGKFVPFTGSWIIEALAAGESAVLNITLFTLVEEQDITYFAQVVALDQIDADSTPDSSSGDVTEDDEAAVTISPKSDGGFGTGAGNSDLELSITADESTYNVYEVVGYTVSVTNNGTDMSTGIEVSTPLPAGMAYTGASTDNGSYSVFFQTWTIDALGVGETATLELDLFTLVRDQPITNFVQIQVANELDPDSTPGNNTTGIPAEDDEAAVTIQVAGNSANLPQANGSIFSSSTFAAHTAVSLAPNPFNGITNFKIQLEEGGEYLLQVFDMNGKEVSRQQIELNEGVNTLSYNGSHLTNGIYNYLLSNEQGFMSGRMILVD